MDNYKLGKYKFNKRMTMAIGVVVIIMAVMIGGGLRQATYDVTNPVESTITIVGDADSGGMVIGDKTISIHATISQYFYDLYAGGSYVPVVRLIDDTSPQASSDMYISAGGDLAISGSLDVTNVPEGIYSIQVVFISSATGEVSDVITGIAIDHEVGSQYTATLTIGGSGTRSGIITIQVTSDPYPTYWMDRIVVKDSANQVIFSSYGEANDPAHIVYFDTADYVNGDYVITGYIYEATSASGYTVVANDFETITTYNDEEPTNNLVTNIYVKMVDGTSYLSTPVANDGTGILYGIIWVEGLVTGDTPTSVYFVVKSNDVEIHRFVMNVIYAGEYGVEFDTTALADGNYDMLVEANFADGSSLQMSAWGFGVVPGTGGETDMTGFIVFGLAAVVIVTFVYGLKKRKMLYT